ncbi:MAG: DUF4190 domain-containing protein [Acidimicrobiia bacterium]
MTVPPPPGGTPPPPPMPPQNPGMPPMPPSPASGQSNTPALIAMILGIISLCGGMLTGIPAVILGFVGKKKANELNGQGNGQAITGIVLGFIGIALSILWIILLIAGAFAADSTTNSLQKSIEKSTKKYNEQTARNGKVASRSDFDVTGAEVQVESYGSVTYKAFITNTASFETGYKIDVKCEGDKGDLKTQTTYAYSLKPDDKESFNAYFYFDQDTTSANCEVTSVEYSY